MIVDVNSRLRAVFYYLLKIGDFIERTKIVPNTSADAFKKRCNSLILLVRPAGFEPTTPAFGG
jgi:hypothetical protein